MAYIQIQLQLGEVEGW